MAPPSSKAFNWTFVTRHIIEDSSVSSFVAMDAIFGGKKREYVFKMMPSIGVPRINLSYDKHTLQDLINLK